MELYSDKEKELKFQLSSPEVSDERMDDIVGDLCLNLGDYVLSFPVDINENWVATVTVPRLDNILKSLPKKGKARASLELHDSEYFFDVWDESIDIKKGRPDLKAEPIEDSEEKEKKPKRKKGKKVEAKVVEETTESEQELDRPEIHREETPVEETSDPEPETPSHDSQPESNIRRASELKLESFSDWKNRQRK